MLVGCKTPKREHIYICLISHKAHKPRSYPTLHVNMRHTDMHYLQREGLCAVNYSSVFCPGVWTIFGKGPLLFINKTSPSPVQRLRDTHLPHHIRRACASRRSSEGYTCSPTGSRTKLPASSDRVYTSKEIRGRHCATG